MAPSGTPGAGDTAERSRTALNRLTAPTPASTGDDDATMIAALERAWKDLPSDAAGAIDDSLVHSFLSKLLSRDLLYDPLKELAIKVEALSASLSSTCCITLPTLSPALWSVVPLIAVSGLAGRECIASIARSPCSAACASDSPSRPMGQRHGRRCCSCRHSRLVSSSRDSGVRPSARCASAAARTDCDRISFLPPHVELLSGTFSVKPFPM